ncbi:hypothetical protein IKQ26_02270 [bacterium]|nr:hypothetical protein [bacterium]
MDSININSPIFREIKKSMPTETAKTDGKTPEEQPKLTGMQKMYKKYETQDQINQILLKMKEEKEKNPDANLDVYDQQLKKLCEVRDGLQKEIDQRISDYYKNHLQK